jgi:hypothetical protein
MAATLATVEAYLTAAQTALSASNYAEARKQAVLAQLEISKLPASQGIDGMNTQYRADLKAIMESITALEDRDDSTRQVLGVWGV